MVATIVGMSLALGLDRGQIAGPVALFGAADAWSGLAPPCAEQHDRKPRTS